MRSRLVETHLSTLFFVNGKVYKSKKALDLGFADFRDLESRHRVCADEVRLNARLSPDVYLGVAELRGEDGVPCDYFVVMRELPEATRLSRLLRDGQDVTAGLRDVAGQLVALHRRERVVPASDAWRPVAELPRLWRLGTDAVAAYPQLVPSELTSRTRALALSWARTHAPLLRTRDAHLVDGHGDLLADDVFLLPDGARILDCLEFDERLRIGDALADAAFLVMDLERLGAPTQAAGFLREFRTLSGDAAPDRLVDYYVAYRAHVRCKVACLRAAQSGEPGDAQDARELAELSLAFLERARPRVVVVGGLPGSGKSTLARGLAQRPGWVALSTDEVRRARDPRPAPFGQGSYSWPRRLETYADLLEQVQTAVRAGSSVVVDGSFAEQTARALVRAASVELDAVLTEICCSTDEVTAEQRLLARARGLSDATPEVRRGLAGRQDPWPEAHAVDTTGPAAETLAAVTRWLANAAPPARRVCPPPLARRTNPRRDVAAVAPGSSR